MTRFPLLGAAAALVAGCAQETPGSPAPTLEVNKTAEADTAPAAPAPGQEASPRAPAAQPPSPVAKAPRAGACDTQDGSALPELRMRAVGTEPFWGARIQGRCVTYSHPEDQAGTRVWTKFAGSAASGTWSGNLNGRPFLLRTRPEPGCSDGMSDRRYPVAVTLTVMGEERQGCAEPL